MESIARILTAAVLLGGVSLSAAEQKTRVIERSPLVPIEKRLLPDDEVVVVQDYPRVSGVEDEPVSVPREIEFLVTFSDAALVVDILDQQGHLVESGLWVNSTISARVVSAVLERKADRRGFLDRSQLDGHNVEILWTHGGEMSIGSVKIRARPTQLEVGHRYLLFLNRIDSAWHLGSRFEIGKDGTLRHLIQPDNTRRYAKSPLDGLPLDRVVRDLRREAARAR